MSTDAQVSKEDTLVIQAAYRVFNARDIDAALELMTPDVEWPNGQDGGYVRGRDAVRAYWTRQWAMIDPHVEPMAMTLAPDERVDVTVHQVVRNLDGALLTERTLHHVYRLVDGLVAHMEISR
jgi:hypothetical protein